YDIMDPVLFPAQFRQNPAHLLPPDQQVIRPLDPHPKPRLPVQGPGDPDRCHQRQLGRLGDRDGRTQDEAQPDPRIRRRMPETAEPPPARRLFFGDDGRPFRRPFPRPLVGNLLGGVDGLQGAKRLSKGAGAQAVCDFFLKDTVWFADQSISALLARFNLITLPPQLLDMFPDGGAAQANSTADFLPAHKVISLFYHQRQDLLSRPSQSEHLPLSTDDDRWPSAPESPHPPAAAAPGPPRGPAGDRTHGSAPARPRPIPPDAKSASLPPNDSTVPTACGRLPHR